VDLGRLTAYLILKHLKAEKQPQVFRPLICTFTQRVLQMKRAWIMISIFVFACVDHDNGEPDKCMGQSKGLVACPEVLDPVCGCNGVTYGNSCLAEAAGVKSWTKGNCD
jgi:hypothetical protein